MTRKWYISLYLKGGGVIAFEASTWEAVESSHLIRWQPINREQYITVDCGSIEAITVEQIGWLNEEEEEVHVTLREMRDKFVTKEEWDNR